MFIECTFECRIANRDLINTTLEVQQFIYIEILIWLRSFSNSKTHPIDNCYRFTWGMAWNIGPKVEIATLELPELKNQISDESVGLEEEYDNTYMNIGRSVGLYDDDDVKYESRPLYTACNGMVGFILVGALLLVVALLRFFLCLGILTPAFAGSSLHSGDPSPSRGRLT